MSQVTEPPQPPDDDRMDQENALFRMDYHSLARLTHQLNKSLSEDGPDSRLLPSVLVLMDEYFCGHFQRQERAMQDTGYPHMDAHIRSHRLFYSRLLTFIHHYDNGRRQRICDLPAMVSAWLHKHILDEDRQFEGWVKNYQLDERTLPYLSLESPFCEPGLDSPKFLNLLEDMVLIETDVPPVSVP